MKDNLPRVVTVEQIYLAAILAELRTMRGVPVAEVEKPVKRQRGRPKKKPDAGA